MTGDYYQRHQHYQRSPLVLQQNTATLIFISLVLLLLSSSIDVTIASSSGTISNENVISSTSTTTLPPPQKTTTPLSKLTSPSTILTKKNNEPSPSSPSTMTTNNTNETKTKKNNDHPLRIIFSDVDGTLVHYPSTTLPPSSSSPHLSYLPPSSTGLRGIISHRTHSLISQLRQNHKILFVLVSGMRYTTMMSRLSFLPRADAYCCDGGGRIFYPVVVTDDDDDGGEGMVVTTVASEEEGAADDDEEMMPFRLVEDGEWRRYITGRDGVLSSPPRDEENTNRDTTTTTTTTTKTFSSSSSSRGLLWDFALILEARGFVIDRRGYETCFRMKRDDQTSDDVKRRFDLLFSTTGDEEGDDAIHLPSGLASSVNLGCIDIYPATSGKKNCCAYLAQKFLSPSPSSSSSSLLLSQSCICICDDDNDIEMAMACRHAYIPSVSSESMRDLVRRYADRVTSTAASSGMAKENDDGEGGGEENGTEATERALELILDGVLEGR